MTEEYSEKKQCWL